MSVSVPKEPFLIKPVVLPVMSVVMVALQLATPIVTNVKTVTPMMKVLKAVSFAL